MPISWEDLQKVSGIRTPTAGRVTPVVDATPAQATQQPQNFVEKFNLLPTLGLLLGAGAGGAEERSHQAVPEDLRVRGREPAVHG